MAVENNKAMEVERVLRMSKGEGKASYACNSTLQKKAMGKAKPYIDKTITELYCKTSPQVLTMADLGCSSGPNSLLLSSSIINTIQSLSQELGTPLPEFHISMNDLPENDFNTLFQFIPFFKEEISNKDNGDKSPSCFVAAVPGSFYNRLFPTNSIFFMHSCYSSHWLSQVPKDIENNKTNICAAETSPPSVLKAYVNQFQQDFSSFLRLRSKETILGGRMVITTLGRSCEDPSSKESSRIWELLGKSILDMVAEGLVEEDKLVSFNLPVYKPSGTELRELIKAEGSFTLDSLETFELNWDANDDPEIEGYVFDNVASARNVAKTIRSVAESMIVHHFGEEIMDDLFHRYAKHVSIQLATEKIMHVVLVMCMTKKE